MKTIQTILILGLTFCGLGLCAQNKWAHYDNTNGLSSSETRVLLADKDNNIWVGTLKGINKFDGNQWESFFQGDFGEGVVEDIQSNIWMAVSGKGLNKWDGNKMVQYTASNGLSGAGEIIRLLADSKGQIWASSWNAGIDMFDGTKWVNYNKTKSNIAGNVVNALLEDSKGNIWFGCERSVAWGEPGGLSRFDGNSWTTFTTTDGLSNNDIRSLYEDKDGNIWVGTSEGVSMYDGNNWKVFSSLGSLADNRITCITQDKRGIIWFGSLSGGMATYDGNNWETFTTNNGLISNKISDVIIDNDGNLWLAYFDKGISSLDIGKLSNNTVILPEQFSVYPNPVNGIMHISGIAKNSIITLSIIDLHGKEVSSLTTEDVSVDTKGLLIDVRSLDLKQGTYRVKIATRNGIRSKSFLVL